MYDPAYTYTDPTITATASIEATKARMQLSDFPYDLRSKLSEQAKTLNLFHIGNMLQLSLTLKDAEKLAQGRKLETEDIRFNVITNFRNVLEFNRSNAADSYHNVDLNLLLHLNKIVLTDWRESWDVKLRSAGEIADENLDDWSPHWDTALDISELATEVSNLVQWNRLGTDTIHPVIRTAIVVHRLARLAPFAGGNKLTAIAVADFMLTKAGYGDKTFLPITRVFDIHNKDFKQTWEYAETVHDLGLWVEKFAAALALELTEARQKAEQIQSAEEEKSASQPFLDLNKRQIKILRYLQTIPTVKREDYCVMMDVSTMTAFRDMTDLVRKKLVKIEGKGRGTKYKLVTRI